MARPLKVGIVLPITEREDGSIARWAELRELAETAEAVGFDSVWIFDHLMMRGSEGKRTGIWECGTMLAALAAATRRVEIGTVVFCTGFRNPALLAKMADTVEEISGGRLILGLGAGWHEPEYKAFGYPFDHRVGRFEEALTIVTHLLREGKVDLDGTYYQVRDCELLPRGPRPKGPQIMVAGSKERMLELTVRHADLWNGAWYGTVEEGAARMKLVDDACRAAGRDPGKLGRTAGIKVDVAGAKGDRKAAAGDDRAALAETLRSFAAAGYEHVQVILDPMTPRGLESFARAFEVLDWS